MPLLTVGDTLPKFSLSDQFGQLIESDSLKGSWSVVYFYPKDDTPGCTKEACSFRDHWSALTTAGIKVYGISKDSVASHRRFAEKYQLPFSLLSDQDATVIKAFGAWGPKKFMGRTFDGILRTTFLIDPHGAIARVYADVTPDQHAATILADHTALTSEPTIS